MKKERSRRIVNAALLATAAVLGAVVAVLWLAGSVSSGPTALGIAESAGVLDVEPSERSTELAAETPQTSSEPRAAVSSKPSFREATAIGAAAEVEATVRAWARAWADQDVESYLSFYSVGFDPADGTSLSEWRQQRYPRLRNPRRIRVVLERIDVRMASAELAIASFDQSYESDTYRDRVRKTLELVLEDGAWVIERELSDEL